MKSSVTSIEEYILQLTEDRQVAIKALRKVIKKNLPKGYVEEMSYGMIGYLVPHSIYPKGYHCNPKLPLPFINLGSQKNFIALYHMGIYANTDLLNWFVEQYPKHCKTKLDMGKGCVRFKKMEDIPIDLIGELCTKITVEQWIECVEKTFAKKK